MKYFYAGNDSQQGPFSREELVDLLQNRTIDRNTLIWCEEYDFWKKVADTDLASEAPKPIPPLPPKTTPAGANIIVSTTAAENLPYATLASPNNDMIKKINDLFMGWWISLIAVPLFGIGVIPATVFMMLLLYRFWTLIPREYAQTTPGKAIGFLFISLFNFYWAFVSYLGLAQNMNRTLELRGSSVRVNNVFCMINCISSCASFVTYILTLMVAAGAEDLADLFGFFWLLVLIVNFVFYILTGITLKKGAIALLEMEKSDRSDS